MNPKDTRRRRLPLGALLAGGVVAAVLAAFVAFVALDAKQKASNGPPAGVTTINVGPAGRHTTKDVSYAQTPPAGGPHNPVWQNCGYYPKPVKNERAVHSLEHGAVWITYRPNLPQSQVETLKDLANKTYVLVSPYPGLPAPVVASAWGKQLRFGSADDGRLEQFVRTYRQGPQTPEPGAPCTGGFGNPS